MQFALLRFLYNQLPMKIVFASSYKTYLKDNTENYVTLCFSFLNKCDFLFFLLILWDGGSIFLEAVCDFKENTFILEDEKLKVNINLPRNINEVYL